MLRLTTRSSFKQTPRLFYNTFTQQSQHGFKPTNNTTFYTPLRTLLTTTTKTEHQKPINFYRTRNYSTEPNFKSNEPSFKEEGRAQFDKSKLDEYWTFARDLAARPQPEEAILLFQRYTIVLNQVDWYFSMIEEDIDENWKTFLAACKIVVANSDYDVVKGIQTQLFITYY